MGDFEKKFPASACRKKKIACSTNVIEKNSCTAVKKYSTHLVARKKNLADHKSPPPPPPQKLNGRPLTSVRRRVTFQQILILLVLFEIYMC